MMQAGRTHICTFSGDMFTSIKLRKEGLLWIKRIVIYTLIIILGNISNSKHKDFTNIVGWTIVSLNFFTFVFYDNLYYTQQ